MHMVETLSEIYPEPGETVFIDKLHFFPDATTIVRAWQGAGVHIVARILDVDGEGNNFLAEKLQQVGVPV